jgi:hypothetical protein
MLSERCARRRLGRPPDLSRQLTGAAAASGNKEFLYALPAVVAVGPDGQFAGLGEEVDLDYQVRLLPASGQAEVRVTLAEGSAVRSLDFDLGKAGPTAASRPMANGSSRAAWCVAAGGRQDQPQLPRAAGPEAASGAYSSRITPHWALFLGDQLVPLRASTSRMAPSWWRAWLSTCPRAGRASKRPGRASARKFRIDNVSRLFDRPTGWMLAGDLGSRRARLGETEVTVAAPVGQGMRRMDSLTLLTFVWPQLQAVFPRNPPKLLLVGRVTACGAGLWLRRARCT